MSKKNKQPDLKNISVTAPKPVSDNFFRYLRTQNLQISIVVAVSAILFYLIKFCFPLPDFFLDSYNYVLDAVKMPEVSYRPHGYGYFLQMVHNISTSAFFTVFVQYLAFLISSLFFFYSADYLFGMPRKAKTAALFLTVINPILLIQTNLISSDSLFSSLTVTWFGLCLWCIARPSWFVLVAQVAVLFCCFHVRYTAIYFPIIAVVFFLISKGKMIYKLVGIFLTLTMIYQTVEQQKDVMWDVTGTRVLSAFSGWQIANNVLCYYKKLDVDKGDFSSEESKVIDGYVKRHINELYFEGNNIGTHYLWTKNSPLKYYLNARGIPTGNTYFHEWCVASEPLNEYGWEIIRHDPIAYLRYFMWLNFKFNFVFPGTEILGNYDRYHAGIPPETKTWFGFTEDYLHCLYPDLQEEIIKPYPAISCVINLANVAFLIAFLVVVIKNRRNIDRDSLRLFLAWGIFYLSFVFFSLFSTLVLLRYLDPLFTLGIVMPFVMWEGVRRVRTSAREDKSTLQPS